MTIGPPKGHLTAFAIGITTVPTTPTTPTNGPERQISRRDFVRAVAAGAAATTIPDWSLAPRVPSEPTGWKTVWLDHLSYRCTDYQKAAAFYVALMGWKVRSDDGARAVLEIGDNAGDIIMAGGLSAPAPAALTDASQGATRAQAMFDGFAWGDRAMECRRGES